MLAPTKQDYDGASQQRRAVYASQEQQTKRFDVEESAQG
jgi:hypothetical protein